MKKKRGLIKLFLFVLLMLLVYNFRGNITSYVISDTNQDQEKIRIANWNLQIFGEAKAEKNDLLNNYLDKIDNYDIVFIQEIRDISGTAFPKLCSALLEYNCLNSSRAGRTSSKEQVVIIYKKNIEIISLEDFNPDSEDRWERPPIKVVFKAKNETITVYNIHVKPDDVSTELTNLEKIVENKDKTILLGDLNADCSYYDNNKENQFDSWHWLISDEEDTTSTNSDCAYDRIILNDNLYKDLSSSGIEKQNITKDLSDHYIVWVELKI